MTTQTRTSIEHLSKATLKDLLDCPVHLVERLWKEHNITLTEGVVAIHGYDVTLENGGIDHKRIYDDEALFELMTHVPEGKRIAPREFNKLARIRGKNKNLAVLHEGDQPFILPEAPRILVYHSYSHAWLRKTSPQLIGLADFLFTNDDLSNIRDVLGNPRLTDTHKPLHTPKEVPYYLLKRLPTC